MPETYEQRVVNLTNALEELSAWLHENMKHSIILMAHEDGVGIYADAVYGEEGDKNYLFHGSALNEGVGDSLVELATVLSAKEEENSTQGQREVTERMLIALRKEVAKLRNPQAKAWEPIALGKTIPCACKESVQGNCHVAIAPSNQYGERLEVIDGADVVSVILPDNIRLCRLVSQEA